MSQMKDIKMVSVNKPTTKKEAFRIELLELAEVLAGWTSAHGH